MFNSTHTLVGFAIARTGAGKWTRHATATAVIASNLPDIDSIAGLWGTAAYLNHHRGITHALIGVPILALVLSAVMYLFSGNFGRTYTIALIAMATHPALDYLNPYGLRPLLPWSGRWYYGDAVFIIDPYLDFVLLIGILAGRVMPNRKRIAAWSCLIIAIAYIAARIELHRMAASKVEAIVAQDWTIEKLAVLPQMLDPWRWEVMVQTNTETAKFSVHALRRPAVPPDAFIRMHRSPPSDIITRAASTPSAVALLRFARFPVARVEKLGTAYRVTFIDFRFYREEAHTALASEVTLDPSMQVINESVSFVNKIN